MKITILFGYLLSALLHAQVLFITDKSDYTVLVKEPRIYYSSKEGSNLNLFYKPDVERNGIRVKQGMGTTVVPWENIQTIHVGEKRDDDTTLATVENNNISTPLVMISPVSGLEAESQLGTFRIDFENVKRIDVVSEEHLQGELLAIVQYLKMPKTALPKSVKTDDVVSLTSFSAQQLKLKKDELKVKIFGQYIIIHYDNAEYEKEHPQWKIRKFGEAVVIDTTQSTFAAFRLSKT